MDLVECVPNFSEGRDPAVVDGIVGAITAVDGARVLHVDSGRSAHRTVVTFAGEAAAVEAAAYAGIEKAAALIDMRRHTGTHPRMGATDVCPFVPIGATDMETCIGMAERVGSRVGESLGIPVYLYAEAARADGRRSLPAIRRGEYEGLEAKMREPGFAPDFGPRTFNARSGATVIGARRFLIAWNVNLDTSDVTVAREIARRLRSSGRRDVEGRRVPGRFRGLQGDGWFIDEFARAQVTFNILDHETTPIAQVYEACREAAVALGANVTGSELVGLVPRDALLAAGSYYGADGQDEASSIATAVDRLGLGELKGFDTKKRVLEYAFEEAGKHGRSATPRKGAHGIPDV